MRAFWHYLRYRAPVLICFAAFSAIILFVMYLGKQVLRYYLYGVLLCFFLLLVLAVPDCIVFIRRKQHMRRLIAMEDGLMELPKPRGIVQADDYMLERKLLARLAEEKAAHQSASGQQAEYFSAWVHQIKTPIAALQLILDTSMPQPRRDEAKDRLSEIERYAAMALYYLRLDATEQDLVLEWCDLDEVVRKAVKGFSTQFIQRGIALRYQPLSVMVLSDRKWLRFALEQIISNAVNYTPQGYVSIDFAGNALHITDSGIGIAPEDLPRVGEKGFTGYNGRTHHKSTGLGLYLVRRILKMLSHGFHIDSEQGKGTMVTIVFSADAVKRAEKPQKE